MTLFNSFIALAERELKRRRFAGVLETLSDHQLRDIGLERKFIDEAVEAEWPSFFKAGRGPSTPALANQGAPALQGCG